MSGEHQEPPFEAASSVSGSQNPGLTSPAVNGGQNDSPNSFNFGGIKFEWPVHEGQYGVEGARKHKEWKNRVLGLMELRKVDKKTAAFYIQSFCKGHAPKFVNSSVMPFDKLDFDVIMNTLDTHFAGEADDEAEVAQNEYMKCTRRFGEPVREYITRLEYVKSEYERLEKGCADSRASICKTNADKIGSQQTRPEGYHL